MVKIVTGNPWEITAGRLDWSTLRDAVDLPMVATRLLGPAGRSKGGYASWVCPFHDDHDPSLKIRRGESRWKCWACGAGGDAIDLVRRLNPSFSFAEAVAFALGGLTPPKPPAAVRSPDPKPKRQPAPAGGLSAEAAAELLDTAERRLWSAEGADDLAALRARGLTDEAIRAARLGSTAVLAIPKANGGAFQARGLVLPWSEGGRLMLVKIRQPDGSQPKYVQAYRDPERPLGLFPGRGAIFPGKPLVIVEGEFDALLLGAALAGLAGVVTTGSASSTPDRPTLDSLIASPRWYIATDADPAGDRAAEVWLRASARARRVRPPGPHKDWTEACQAGVNLRRWWTEILQGLESPALYTLDELVEWRW